MTAPGIPLDVCLNGGRPYVQGSQMLARAAELVPGVTHLEGAGFRRITDRLVTFIPDGVEGEQSLGWARFTTPQGPRSGIFEPAEVPAPKRDLANPLDIARLDDVSDPDSGRFAFGRLHDFEGLLTLLIQTVKSLHERGRAGSHDVWFTGQRGAPLPLDLVAATGTAEARIDRVLGRAPAFQTFCSVRLFDDAGAQMLESFVTFAFKREADAG